MKKPELQDEGWISVAEGLPELYARIWVKDGENVTDSIYGNLWIDKPEDVKFLFISGLQGNDVTHWMPLTPKS